MAAHEKAMKVIIMRSNSYICNPYHRLLINNKIMWAFVGEKKINSNFANNCCY